MSTTIDNNNNNLQLVVPSKYDAPYHITEYTQIRRKIDIYFSRAISGPSYYAELCQLIRMCDVEDVIYLYLNTVGGSVDAGVQIINAIRDCQGKVVTVLDGTVCSMGAIIFLTGHEFIVHNTGRLMFHNYSGGVIGKGHEQIAQLQSTSLWFDSIMQEICYPFLTNAELQSISEGRDYWMSSAQVRERLDVLHNHELKQMKLLNKKTKPVVKKLDDVVIVTPLTPTPKPKPNKPIIKKTKPVVDPQIIETSTIDK